jgi:hypothetical protein
MEQKDTGGKYKKAGTQRKSRRHSGFQPFRGYTWNHQSCQGAFVTGTNKDWAMNIQRGC